MNEKYEIINYDKNENKKIGTIQDFNSNKYFFKQVISDNINYINILKNEVKNLLVLKDLSCVPKVREYNFLGNENYIVYEYIKGYNLKKLVTNDFLEKIDIFVEILNCVEKIHKLGIIHCDLKPSNIMIANNDIKIIDFEISINDKVSLNKNEFVTIKYCAPEQFLKQRLSVQTDIYSLGVIFYEIITKKLPFNGTNNEIMNNKIKNNFEKVNNDLLNNIFSKAMNYDVNKRYKNIEDFKCDVDKLRKMGG